MPFPLVSHQGLAAPALLVDRRGRLDGVALMVGSVAPDVLYAFTDGADDHMPWLLLWWCVPLSVAVASVCRLWVARPLAAHLPDLGPLRVRDIARAAIDRPGMAAAALSGLLGAITHVVADGFTHPEPWVSDQLTWLYHEVPFPVKGKVYLYNLLRFLGTVGGAVLAIVVTWLAARRRTAAGVPHPALPAPTRRSALRLWGWTLAGALLGAGIVANSWFTPGTRPQAVMQATIVASTALLIGCRHAAASLDDDTGTTETGAEQPEIPTRSGLWISRQSEISRAQKLSGRTAWVV
jgi:hypothetical protein